MNKLAGLLAAAGVAMGAAQAASALTLDKLRLTSIASSDDAALADFDGMAVWRVTNPNAAGVDIELKSLALGESQFAQVINGNTFFAFDFVVGNANTTKLFWFDDEGNRFDTVKASGGAFDYTGVSAVPLPAGMLLLATGVGAFAVARRRKA